MTCVWLSESTLVAGGKFLFTILVAINVYLSYFSYYKLVTIQLLQLPQLFSYYKCLLTYLPCYNWCKTRNIRQIFYDELGLHSLSKKRWRNKLIFFHKMLNRFLPKQLYLYLTFPSQENYPLKSALTNKINFIPSGTKFF